MKQKSVSMLKWLIGKYSVQAHLMHQATYSLCMNNCRFVPLNTSFVCSFLHHWRRCVFDFKPTNRLWKSLDSVMLFACVFSLLCIVFSTLRDFSPLLLHLCSRFCHKLGIKGPFKRASSKWTWQQSQGVVIWVDMQINISHHQPLVGGAWGQDDEVWPIRSLI